MTRRIVVVGTSGSGKTTLARQLAGRLGVAHIELDALYHRAGWTTLEPAEFRRQVDHATRGEVGWVVDGNHQGLTDLLWPRADAVVWLDLPRPVVMVRVIARTVARAVRRPELWNGNRQRLADVLSLDPSRSVVALAWSTHARDRRAYETAAADPRWAELRVVHVTSRRDPLAQALAGLGPEL